MKLILAAIFVLIVVDPARSDSGQLPLAPLQGPVRKECGGISLAEWRALQGKSKAHVIRRIGHPDIIARARGGAEIWRWGTEYIILQNGVVIAAETIRQTGVVDEVEELP